MQPGAVPVAAATRFGKRLIVPLADGSIAWQADVQEGFENAPATLRRLYTGANIGKQLLRI